MPQHRPTQKSTGKEQQYIANKNADQAGNCGKAKTNSSFGGQNPGPDAGEVFADERSKCQKSKYH